MVGGVVVLAAAGAGVVAGLGGVGPTSTKKEDCFLLGCTVEVGRAAVAVGVGAFEAERSLGTPPANKLPKVSS